MHFLPAAKSAGQQVVFSLLLLLSKLLHLSHMDDARCDQVWWAVVRCDKLLPCVTNWFQMWLGQNCDQAILGEVGCSTMWWLVMVILTRVNVVNRTKLFPIDFGRIRDLKCVAPSRCSELFLDREIGSISKLHFTYLLGWEFWGDGLHSV